MLSSFTTRFANSLVLTFQAGIVYSAFKSHHRSTWLVAACLLAALSFFAWFANHRRHRAITDIPLSRIASAAQGYVGLQGVAEAHEGMLITHIPQGLPSVWRKYIVTRGSGDNAETIDSGISSSTFLLRDEGGSCVIDPDDAEVITDHKRVFYEGDYKHTEYYLLPNDPLYVLGEFITQADPSLITSVNQAVGDLLAEWKQDKSSLLRRFDKNKDGEINIEEWELARQEAKRHIQLHMTETRSNGGMHIVRKPSAKRLYLLSNIMPEQLAARYFYWGWFHLMVFFLALVVAVWSGLLR
jgi:hypothetical protein